MLLVNILLVVVAVTSAHSSNRHSSFGPNIEQTYNHQINHQLPIPLDPADASSAAITFLADKLSLDAATLALSNSYISSHNQIAHVYIQQVANNIPIANAVANVNLDIANGKIVSFGSSLYLGNAPAPLSIGRLTKRNFQMVLGVESETMDTEPQNIMDPSSALFFFAKHLDIELDQDSLQSEPIMSIMSMGGTLKAHAHNINNVNFALHKSVPSCLSYIQVVSDNGESHLRLVWDLQVEMIDNWFHAHVDAVTGKVHSSVDWVADSQYTVFPLGINDPMSGARITVKDPENRLASPLGWNTHKTKNYTTTIGNNVYAQENLDGSSSWKGNYRPDGKALLNFDFPFQADKDPDSYVDAAITNLFYWNNIIHDLFYLYGFNEQAGNFQEYNHGLGGRGMDAVIANAQDGSGYNNANFATPPDGQHAKMRMYVWSESKPMRDGDFESGIIIHEYAHGISTRLTGGPANSGCLGWGEAGGMGEGWGDFFATIFRHTKNTQRSDNFAMGEYANNGHGIRKFIYSSDMKTNPSTYGFIEKPGYWGVHAKGEVWAAILLEAYWELVSALGFDEDWYCGTSDGHLDYLNLVTGQRVARSNAADSLKRKKEKILGNTLALQLVVDGMKLQPCYPSFVDARDAIIEADVVGFKGKHVCLLWRGFAKRGLGDGAKSGGRESFKVPARCQRDAV